MILFKIYTVAICFFSVISLPISFRVCVFSAVFCLSFLFWFNIQFFVSSVLSAVIFPFKCIVVCLDLIISSAYILSATSFYSASHLWLHCLISAFIFLFLSYYLHALFTILTTVAFFFQYHVWNCFLYSVSFQNYLFSFSDSL